MFFTREPIIESIITPKEGCKLVIRSSKGTSQEDYYVDAVEIVSFGSSIFYRSLEKPKCFLLPIQDYEVVELKETRMVLKNASLEGSIKIATSKETHSALPSEAKDAPKKRRSRRKRTSEKQPPKTASEETPKSSDVATNDETPAYLSKLLPPPPTLIQNTLTKTKEEELLDANLYPEEKQESEASSPEEKVVEEPEVVSKKEPLQAQTENVSQQEPPSTPV